MIYNLPWSKLCYTITCSTSSLQTMVCRRQDQSGHGRKCSNLWRQHRHRARPCGAFLHAQPTRSSQALV